MKKKFEIQIINQNLFLLVFNDEDNLESILKGIPWLFRRKVVLFDPLGEPIERKKIRLVISPFWIKVSPYHPKCESKDLMNAIGSTFGGLLRLKAKEDYSHQSHA